MSDFDLHHPALADHRRHSAGGGRKAACGSGRDGFTPDHHHCGYHHAADLLQHCKDAAASVKDTRIGMPGGSGKLPGIFFAKGGRQEPGMAGDLQKIAEMKRKNAEEQG